MTLVRLTDGEELLLQKIKRAIPQEGLRSYLQHMQWDGYNLSTEAQVRIGHCLWEKGWLAQADEPKMLFKHHVHLSPAAWKLYALDEWEQVEREELEEKFTESYGDW